MLITSVGNKRLQCTHLRRQKHHSLRDSHFIAVAITKADEAVPHRGGSDRMVYKLGKQEDETVGGGANINKLVPAICKA